jgi:hypothetical protein
MTLKYYDVTWIARCEVQAVDEEHAKNITKHILTEDTDLWLLDSISVSES